MGGMWRCYTDARNWGGQMTLSPAESHHLVQVRRASVGDTVVVFDGRGREAQTEIVAVEAGCVRVRVLSGVLRPRPRVAITLLQALPRGPRMDFIVEKATELGLARLCPVQTERSVLRLDAAQAANRHERWRRIAAAAAKQCGAGWVPDVMPVTGLAAAIENVRDSDVALLASLEPDARLFRDVAAELRPGRPSRIAILVGPEGDLTHGEIAAARSAGYVAVSLGAQVLRVDTAALVAMSLVAYEFMAGAAS